MSVWPQGLAANPNFVSSVWTITSLDQSASVVFQWNPSFDSDSFGDSKYEIQKILNIGASAEVIQAVGLHSPIRTLGKGGDPLFVTRGMLDGLNALYYRQFTDGGLLIFPRSPWDSTRTDDSATVFMTDLKPSREIEAHGELFKIEMEFMYVTIPVSAMGYGSTLLNGLAGYWKFDEGAGANVSDSSGNGYAGTTMGSAPYWSTGKINYGGSFNGTNNYVSVGSSPIMVTSAGTYSVWFNAAGAPAGWEALINQGNFGSTKPDMAISLHVSKVEAYIGSSASVSAILSSASYIIGSWCHAAFTWDGVTAILYLNGAKVGQVAFSSGPIDLSQWPLAFGCALTQSGSISSLYTGLIDEVGIWSRCLTPAEVLAIWNGGAGRSYPFL